MKIEAKTTLTFKDGTTVNVDEAELRELLAARKARFEQSSFGNSSLQEILKEKERKTRDEDARPFNPGVVLRELWNTPWNRPYWDAGSRIGPLSPSHTVTCQSTTQ